MPDSQQLLSLEYSVEYRLINTPEDHWYAGAYSGPNEQAAVDECRRRWADKAIVGVRYLERRVTAKQSRLR